MTYWVHPHNLYLVAPLEFVFLSENVPWEDTKIFPFMVACNGYGNPEFEHTTQSGISKTM